MRILIIEDDKTLSYEMKEGLEQRGFIIDVANTGTEGEEMAFITNYDAVLLDLNLPDKDGIEILSFLRENDRNIPVIIVSARDKIEHRISGLNLGADDYIIKPFDFEEMTSRIHAVIRRFYGRSNPQIKIENLLINPKERTVYYFEDSIELTTKEFDILAYIAQNYPNVVSSEMIAEHVYDEFFDPFSSVLRVHIANLRKKLKLCAGHDLLLTLKGKGYRLWGD